MGAIVSALFVGLTLAQARKRIAAALTIHAPCHTATTKPWDCSRHADLDRNGLPSGEADCVDCIDCSENPIPYPCPTALALGVLPEGAPNP